MLIAVYTFYALILRHIYLKSEICHSNYKSSMPKNNSRQKKHARNFFVMFFIIATANVIDFIPNRTIRKDTKWGNQKPYIQEEQQTTQWPKEKGQTTLYKSLHRKLMIEQHEW